MINSKINNISPWLYLKYKPKIIEVSYRVKKNSPGIRSRISFSLNAGGRFRLLFISYIKLFIR